MHLSLEERSELRLAISAAFSDPSVSAASAAVLRSAYAKLAKADGLDAAPCRSVPGRVPSARSVGHAFDRLFPVVEEELAATARAVLSLDDRIARSPLLSNAIPRLP